MMARERTGIRHHVLPLVSGLLALSTGGAGPRRPGKNNAVFIVDKNHRQPVEFVE